MKRLITAVLAIIFLLSGCAGEGVETTSEPAVDLQIAGEAVELGVFSAAAPGAEDVTRCRELLEQTLALYPEGFWEQLGNVEVLLTGELTGTGPYAHGSYAGFTQRVGTTWQMVLDVTACDAGTIHHEIAHILDGILTDAGVLTEADWMALCPVGFAYSGDYAARLQEWEQYPDFFVDSYAMVSILEDRARLFETAVLEGEGAFADRPALWLKLSLLSEAIRAQFDTSGWPDRTVWELALE